MSHSWHCSDPLCKVPRHKQRWDTDGQGWASFTRAHSGHTVGKVQPHSSGNSTRVPIHEHTAFMCAQCRSNAFGIKLTDQADRAARVSQLRPSSTISSWHKVALSSSAPSYNPSVDIGLKLSLIFAATLLSQPKRQK